MLSKETARYLAKAMQLAQKDGHELLTLSFNRDPDPEENPVEVLCAATDLSPESVAIMAREALGYFAQPGTVIN